MSDTQSANNSTDDDGGSRRYTIDDALRIAVEEHQKGKFDTAREVYETVLSADPTNATALQFLGVVHHQQGRDQEGLALLRRATEIAPEAPGVWMNFGNVLLETGDANGAVEAYERMLKLAPDNSGAWNNMGILLRTMGRASLAEEALRKAIEIAPEDAGPWHNLGNLLLSTGRVEESISCALKAITLLPGSSVGRKLLGVAYAYLGETEKARKVFQEWLDESPDDPTARHHLAALDGEVPERASDEYVETVFDNFASSFDSRLENLEYRAPQIVADAMEAGLAADQKVSILDVGCGTGLVGPLVRARASNLVGIDLSGKMLDRAKTRNVYDTLTKAEFISYLAAVEEPFDVLIAADALCYVGWMEDFSVNAVKSLTPGGLFIGTFEADPDNKDVTLTNTGRFTHGEAYLQRTFEAAGFAEVSCKPDVLRMEQGRPVNGWIVTGRRPA